MKNVRVDRDYEYTPHRKFTVRFSAGVTYSGVIDAAAAAIVRNGAGQLVDQVENGVDARRAFRVRFSQGFRNARW